MRGLVQSLFLSHRSPVQHFGSDGGTYHFSPTSHDSITHDLSPFVHHTSTMTRILEYSLISLAAAVIEAFPSSYKSVTPVWVLRARSTGVAQQYRINQCRLCLQPCNRLLVGHYSRAFGTLYTQNRNTSDPECHDIRYKFCPSEQSSVIGTSPYTN